MDAPSSPVIDEACSSVSDGAVGGVRSSWVGWQPASDAVLLEARTVTLFSMQLLSTTE